MLPVRSTFARRQRASALVSAAMGKSAAQMQQEDAFFAQAAATSNDSSTAALSPSPAKARAVPTTPRSRALVRKRSSPSKRCSPPGKQSPLTKRSPRKLSRGQKLVEAVSPTVSPEKLFDDMFGTPSSSPGRRDARSTRQQTVSTSSVRRALVDQPGTDIAPRADTMGDTAPGAGTAATAANGAAEADDGCATVNDAAQAKCPTVPDAASPVPEPEPEVVEITLVQHPKLPDTPSPVKVTYGARRGNKAKRKLDDQAQTGDSAKRQRASPSADHRGDSDIDDDDELMTSSSQGIAVVSEFAMGEKGRAQQHVDHVQYLLDGVATHQPLGVRASAMWKLAELCRDADMALELRAHDMVPRILDAVLRTDHLTLVRADAQHADAASVRVCMSAVAFCLGKDALNTEYLHERHVPVLVALLAASPHTASSPDKPGSRSAPHRKAGRRLALRAGRRDAPRGSSSTNSTADAAATAAAAAAASSAVLDPRLARLVPADRPLIHSSSVSSASSELDLASLFILDMMLTMSKDHARLAEMKHHFRVHGVLSALAALAQRLAAGALPTAHTAGSDGSAAMLAVLQTLENMTFLCRENQDHLLGNDAFLTLMFSLLRRAAGILDSPGVLGDAVLDILLAVLRVLINLCNANDEGISVIGTVSEHLACITRILDLALRSDDTHLPTSLAYDLRLHTLGLLVNLCEGNTHNAKMVARVPLPSGADVLSVVVALYQRSLDEPAAAATATASAATPTGGAADAAAVLQADAQQQQVESNVTGAYAALLLGCLVRQNPAMQDCVRGMLPDQSYAPLVRLLEQFVAFKSQAGILSEDAFNRVMVVIRALKALDA